MSVSHQVSHDILVSTALHGVLNTACRESACSSVDENEDIAKIKTREFLMPIQLVTIQQVQERLKISRSSVYRLIQSGQLDVVHVMGSLRIIDHSVDCYIDNHTTWGTAVSR